MATQNEDQNLASALLEDDSSFDIRRILSFIWRMKLWIIVCVVLALSVAFVYIKLQVPQYNSNSTVMFVDTMAGNNEATLMTEITGRAQGGRKDDEIVILRSVSLMSRVISTLDLNYRYYHCKIPVFRSSLFKGMLAVKEDEYYMDNPFAMDIIWDPYYSPSSLPERILVQFEAVGEDSYRLKKTQVGSEIVEYGKKEEHLRHFGDSLSFNGAKVVISKKGENSLRDGDLYKATYQTPKSLAYYLTSRLSVAFEQGLSNIISNVLYLSFVDTNPNRACDVLRTLVEEYNKDAKMFKSKSAISSIEFIDERIKDISRELGSVESEYKDYQTRTDYIDGLNIPGVASTNYESQLIDLRVQKTFLKMVKDEMVEKDENSVIPVNIGMTDSGLNQAIGEYNEMVTERDRLLVNSSESNPSVLRYNARLKSTRNNLILLAENLEKVYNIRENELMDMTKKAKQERSAIPTRQLDLAQISRRQQIIEPLYLLLNQKKEEMQLSIYTITDNVRVIEEPTASYNSSSPNKNRILLFAIFLGIFFPLAIMLIRSLLRTKVETREDLKKSIHRPILSTLPKSDGSIIGSSGSRDAMAESFRMLRSNLQYIQGKVIQVTSSVSGEGKTFVAANLAVSLSHVNRSVAILGLDLRKPRLQRMLGNLTADKGRNIVSYLIGKTDKPEDIARPYITEGGKVDVFFSGPVPPNPSELLSLERMDMLMEYCKQHYDYVICDTAPFLMVSDSVIINKFADITLYVVRADYTDLKMLKEIREPMEEGKLKNVNLILNCVDIKSSKYRYGYEYGYSNYGGSKYGYGYGYGYGYYGHDDDNPDRVHHYKKEMRKELSKLKEKINTSTFNEGSKEK